MGIEGILAFLLPYLIIVIRPVLPKLIPWLVNVISVIKITPIRGEGCNSLAKIKKEQFCLNNRFYVHTRGQAQIFKITSYYCEGSTTDEVGFRVWRGTNELQIDDNARLLEPIDIKRKQAIEMKTALILKTKTPLEFFGRCIITIEAYYSYKNIILESNFHGDLESGGGLRLTDEYCINPKNK